MDPPNDVQDPQPQLAASESEEMLDSEDKIELNAFLERKGWIEDKCAVLESMPPIEVFAGLEQLLDSDNIPSTLPTRKQLADWLAEHDAIEKETEMFDSGDMIRLKKFAKAATEKHLSPEDTDLIEVTLNTLFALDKLLHLLRARSDTLDLLGLRLTWEEQRIGARKERHKLLDDLRSFLVSRARWSPAAYDALAATIANGSAGSNTDTAVLNRSARYKHTELLSHDAAQFTGRVIALRNAFVNPAGKTLDKLIEASTQGPVPDQILDEQDRVEDQCMNELEGIGKFAINTVMQWKRADELYGELKKDQLTAEALESDIRNALLSHPTLKLDVGFSSRAQALSRRLQLIGDPKSTSSSFPRPIHHLFPDQQAANDSIATLLSDELRTSLRLARNLEEKVKQYHSALVAVQRVEAARAKMTEVTKQLTEFTNFVTKGDPSQPNGSPPDLESLSCLDPVAHSAFLAMLPSRTSRMPSLETAAGKALHETESSLMTLPSRGIDSSFRAETSDEKEKLIAARTAAVQAGARVKVVVNDMKAARSIWSTIGEIASDLDNVQEDTLIALTRQRYRGQLSSNGAPLTPESPNAPLPHSRTSLTDVTARLETVRKRIDGEVLAPLRQVSPRLPSTLAGHLETTARSLGDMASGMHSLTNVWDLVARQAQAMDHIHDEVQKLEQGIETARGRITSTEAEILGQNPGAERLRSIEASQERVVAEQRQVIQWFTDSLAARVPLVNRSEVAAASLAKAVSASDSDQVPRARSRRLSMSVAPPDLAALDSAVRADANGLSINLAGSLLALEKSFERLKVAGLAVSADALLDPWLTDIQNVEQTLSDLKQTLATLSNAEPNETLLPALDDVKEHLATLQNSRSEIGRARSPVREAIHQLQTGANALQFVAQEDFVTRRVRAFESAEHKLDIVDESIASLGEHMDKARASEVKRLRELEEERIRQEEERQRVLEERHRQEEEARRAEEERLRLEEEERLRKAEEEQFRLEAEARKREEEERMRREEEERLREVERLRREEEERLRREEEECLRREEEDRSRKEEEERQRKEEVERLRLHEIARLAEEARLRAEAEERERQEAKAQQLEEERIRLEAEALQSQRDEEERLRAEEQDRIVELKWEQQREIDRRATVDNREFFSSETITFPTASTSTLDTIAQWAAQLRARLSALHIIEMVRPRTESNLPSHETVQKTLQDFAALASDISALLAAHPEVSDGELVALRKDKDRCASLLPRLTLIGDLALHILFCDNALSDLLEHVDFYPVAPVKHLAAIHRSDPSQTPQEQLSARISFTKQAIEDMQSDFNPIADDSRAASERDRVLQTWNELHDMAMDRLVGNRSRAPSVTDSVYSGTSNTSRLMGPPAQPRSRATSVISSSRGKPSAGLLATPRRASKGAVDNLSRPASKMSMRSVSGPLATNSSLFNSTFSSRQRTTSLSSQPTSTPQKNREQSPVLVPGSARVHRVASPSPSLTSSGRQSRGSPRSTFARAPRFSLDGPSPLQKAKRKPYVANAKSKLDVAVGEVVNKLPEDMAIHIEPITWKDTSGKYWIGDSDPKLCFCRILRSQTVMVRVGGGWMELSRFVKNHFTNVYRIGPDSVPDIRPPQEEKWISSTTLLQTLEKPVEETWQPPRTPEPRTPSHVPSFSLSTPNGTSPRSLPSSGSSPLTPLQFMRRAEEHLVVPPTTPAKTPSKRGAPSTPARAAIWRP